MAFPNQALRFTFFTEIVKYFPVEWIQSTARLASVVSLEFNLMVKQIYTVAKSANDVIVVGANIVRKTPAHSICIMYRLD